MPNEIHPIGFEHNPQQSWSLPADFLVRIAESSLNRDAILLVLNLFALLGSEAHLAVEKTVYMESTEMLFNVDKERLGAALTQAEQAGFILSYVEEKTNKAYYLAGTPQGRSLMTSLEQGLAQLESEQVVSRLPLIERPNIYKLYEANIGPLTPMMAEMLKEDEATYPYDWIEDAVKEAVERNKRSWRYVRAILKAWKERGRDNTEKQEGSIVEEYRRLYEEQRKRRGGKHSD